MRSSRNLDRIGVVFDDARQVADAGLLLPATLAEHLGLKGLVERFLDLGRAAGRANVGDKLLTLVFSALAGGDCIDDAAALRAGRTERVLPVSVKAPSTLGTFLRRFRWAHAPGLSPLEAGGGFVPARSARRALKADSPRILPTALLREQGVKPSDADFARRCGEASGERRSALSLVSYRR